ncbi:MAG: LysR family transcriptional regulator [Lachnospiraceae bacterium]|jgi:DNA-binding transcriptional LysR family regulator
MTITQMEYFVAVCKYGSISKSSEIMHVSQPTISMSIKTLEEEFGITLFNRESRKLIMTQEGVYVYNHIVEILKQIDDLTTYMLEIGKHQSHLSLAIPIFSGTFLCADALKKFHAEHEDVLLRVMECSSMEAIDNLNNGSISAAIIVDRNLPINDDIEKATLLETHFKICMGANHPLAGNDSISMKDFAPYPLILNKEDSYMTTEVKKHFWNAGYVPRISMYVPRLKLIKNCLQDNHSLTFLYADLANSMHDIISVPLEDDFLITFSLVWNKNKAKSKKLTYLLDTIRNQEFIDYENLT